jgi:molybdate-binding protein
MDTRWRAPGKDKQARKEKQANKEKEKQSPTQKPPSINNVEAEDQSRPDARDFTLAKKQSAVSQQEDENHKGRRQKRRPEIVPLHVVMRKVGLVIANEVALDSVEEARRKVTLMLINSNAHEP